jgi:hypothetical protein
MRGTSGNIAAGRVSDEESGKRRAHPSQTSDCGSLLHDRISRMNSVKFKT